MPGNVTFQADNTCREQRNQWAMLFLAWQVGLKVWHTGTQLFLPVGHSHNEVDQRFPAVALALARAEVLQTPQAQGGHVADLRGCALAWFCSPVIARTLSSDYVIISNLLEGVS